MNTRTPDISSASLLSPGSARDVQSARYLPSEEPLITKGRAAKLELLVYLIANLKSHLIVSGPKGIGKSRVLRLVEGHSQFHWTVCLMGGDRLDLEQIKQRLSAVAGGAMGIDPRLGLERCLEAFEAKNRQLVALIDDAATTPGGILDALYHLADKHRALRLVLAMTRDELDGSMQSDTMLAKFHIVEIPSLNNKQCGEFFHRIAAPHSPSEPREPVSKALAAKIFRDTQGIPGRLIETLPRIEALKAQDRKSRQLMTYGGIGIGVIMTGVLFILLNSLSGEDERAEIRPSPASSQSNQLSDRQTVQSRVAGPFEAASEVNHAEVVADNPESISTFRKTKGSSKSDLTGQGNKPLDNRTSAAAQRQNDGNSARNKKMLPTADVGSVASKFAAAGLKGDDWLLAKNSSNYTLQIMAAQKPDPLITFAAQHPELRDLAYFRTWKNGSEWIAMVYGSFDSPADASRAAGRLPASLGKPWPRTFKAIHQKIHSLKRN